jgi:DNA-binding transcriptional LysR family regulator
LTNDGILECGDCPDLDLWSIRCLLVLGDERHYGRAAARLHMSQPGLSRSIAVLERRVGLDLVVRSTRPVRLTLQGEILALYGRRLLAEQRVAFEHLAASLTDRDIYARRRAMVQAV